MHPFLALIVPTGIGGPVDPGYTPPGVGAPGSRPPAQPGKPVDPAYGIPETGLPKPEHPIYYPLPPGAPVDPAYGIPEDTGKPIIGGGPAPGGGAPAHPISGVGTPEHPIVLPPDQGGGWGPIYVWGGGPGARPPIALPPEGQQPEGKVQWKAVWTPSSGWQTIGIVVPTGAHPAPAKK